MCLEFGFSPGGFTFGACLSLEARDGGGVYISNFLVSEFFVSMSGMVPLPPSRHYFRPLCLEKARLRDDVFSACIGVFGLEEDARPRNPVPPFLW